MISWLCESSLKSMFICFAWGQAKIQVWGNLINTKTLPILKWFQVLFIYKSSGNHLESVLNFSIYRFQVIRSYSWRNQVNSSRKGKQNQSSKSIHPKLKGVWTQKMQGNFIHPKLRGVWMIQKGDRNPYTPSIHPVWKGRMDPPSFLLWLFPPFFFLIYI